MNGRESVVGRLEGGPFDGEDVDVPYFRGFPQQRLYVRRDGLTGHLVALQWVDDRDAADEALRAWECHWHGYAHTSVMGDRVYRWMGLYVSPQEQP